MSAPLSLGDARAVVDACEVVTAGARSTLDDADRVLADRTAAHEAAVQELAAAELAFDAAEDHAAATRVTTARAALANADLLLARATERRAQAAGSLEVAGRARDQAKVDLRVATLRAELDTKPEPIDSLEAARDRLAQARAEVAAARADALAEIREVFARREADEQRIAALRAYGVNEAPTSGLYLVADLLARLQSAGQLRLDTRPTWRGKWTIVDDPAGMRITEVEVEGHGSLSAALLSLSPLLKAVASEDAEAVLQAVDELEGTPDEASGQVIREVLELVKEHRAHASVWAAVVEREAFERAAQIQKAHADAEKDLAQKQASEDERQREIAESRRKYLEQQARLGNASARRALGVSESLPILEGKPLPTLREIGKRIAASAAAFVAEPRSDAPDGG